MRVSNRNRRIGLLLATAASFWAQAALAQPASAPSVEEVTVTGTSIRGVQPVGANLISVGRTNIDATAAQTVQDILKQVPTLSNLGQASQGNVTPAIHNLGAVSSYSTLVLIDGHRFAYGGATTVLPDAGVLPPDAIERIEVLADAASSTYGSDAVAGVINLVTRRDFSGFEAKAQKGFGDHFNTLSFSAIGGATWEHGYIMATAAHSYRSPLFSRYRDFLNPDHRAQGGSNAANNLCDTATFQPGGAGGVFLGNAATTPIVTPSCSTYPYSTVLSQDVRTNGMLKVGYDVSDRLKFTADVNISDRHSKNPSARGTINGVTAYRAGSTPTVNSATAAQDNPFYTQNPAGYAGTSNFESIFWNADQLLSELKVPAAYTTNNALNWFAHGEAEYDITPTWRVTAMALYGYEYDEQGNYNTLCPSCVNLALNGTTNGRGNPTTPSIGNTIVLGTPLTAANALDLWNPAASNGTSAATLRSIVDNNQLQSQVFSTTQLRLGTDAKIFSLPGGDVSVAVGAEWVRGTVEQNKTVPNNTGPATYGALFLSIPMERHVTSLYGEVLIPIIGAGNALPFIKKLTINGSARYDRYNDVGDTTNPKVGIDWQVVDDFKLRADFATSFVAPQLSSVGDRSRGGFNNFTCYGSSCPAGGINVTSGTFNVSPASFPSVVGVPLATTGTCLATATTCSIAATSGTLFNGGPANPRPSKGESWSVGFDTSPSFIPGLTVNFTLFDVRYIGFITGTSTANALTSPSLGLINFYPAGLNPAQVAALLSPYAQLTGSLPATTYYLVSGRQGNFNNVSTQGIDATVDYNLPTDNFGTFDFGTSVTQFLRFKQHLAGGQAFYSILNTTGVNSTFGAVQTQARLHFGWEMDAFGLDLYDNFIGSYRNWSGSTGQGTAGIPLVTRADGAPISGGDKVRAQHYFELNVRYNLPNTSFLGDALAGGQVYVDVTNLFDSAPAFYNNGGSGYDAAYTGDPTGRVVTLGFRLKM
jgi:iron complex outermembrane receptor protein